MDGHVDILISVAIVIVTGAAVILHLWPKRRCRTFFVRRHIAAPREHIWHVYVTDPDDPQSGDLHGTVKLARVVSTDPEILEFVGTDKGQEDGPTIQIETLSAQRPEYAAFRCLSIGDQALPYGPDHVEDLRLEDGPDGIIATQTWHGENRTLGQYREMRDFYGQYMDSLKSFCETGIRPTDPPSIRSPWKSLGLTALGVASFIFLFGWVLALILSAVILIHEFGHWLAMRMTGQPRPRVMPIPFLGGVAVPNHPYKSQFDDAFVSLMGAGISLIPCLALLGGAMVLDPAELTKSTKFAVGANSLLFTADGLLAIALLVAVLNGLQLLPLPPLDGGHVLRSLIQSASVDRARPIMLGLAGIGMIGFALLEEFVLVAILVLGALQAWQLGTTKPTARPMGSAGLATIGVAYCLLFSVYAGIVVFAAPAIENFALY